MAPPFLPQVQPRFPGNANVANQLAALGKSIGGAISQTRNRNQLLEIAQRAQQGNLEGAANSAFGSGRIETGLKLQDRQREQRTRQVNQLARDAAIVEREQDPTRRQQLWEHVLSRVPNRGSLDPVELDPVTGPRLLISQSAEALDLIKGTRDKPQSTLGRLDADRRAGRISEEDFNARKGKLTTQNTFETIRRKVASGEPLTVGENEMREEALQANPLASLVADSLRRRDGSGPSQGAEGGTGQQPPASGDGIPTVSTEEEALALPPGTQFRTPDGRLKVRP